MSVLASHVAALEERKIKLKDDHKHDDQSLSEAFKLAQKDNDRWKKKVEQQEAKVTQ